MPTTTNYGWTTPADTDLVKDGASAIRTLGNGVDTTVKNLNPETTLGDISYRSSTANTNTRLAIGTTGQILTVSGGVPTWATPSSGGGMTELASGSLSGASVNLTSISGSYVDLRLDILNYKPATDDTPIYLQINGDTSTSYVFNATYTNTYAKAADTNYWLIGQFQDNAVAQGFTTIRIFQYANSGIWKTAQGTTISNNATTTTQQNTYQTVAQWQNTSAITSLLIYPSTGNFTSGTYKLYGIK